MDRSGDLLCVFLMQFSFLIGKIDGFKVICKLIPDSQELIAQVWTRDFSRLKALWEAFGKAARRVWEKEPEEVLNWIPMVLQTINEFKGELDKVEADPSYLAENDKFYQNILAGNKMPGKGWLH